ncbi:hypothetical protein [Quadrisphaera setariae]|uniref:Nucleotidyl transferase AbiEii toxin, Type IV TA system n=1 Tax=Quadrisphaera setariae TaxID=2593304 RepID=A0A5C8ZIQ0_9ACTN|nr:hypothetical protein [Quadrisphaera setariae]TXR56993.1 hypothetical protein FMM08_05720 [Quadrisphaera setariae]
MAASTPTPSDAVERLHRRQRQDALQHEADQVVDDLALDALLRRVGRPHRVGSSRLGLVVWRDIDITVVCDHLDIRAVGLLAGDLVARGDVREVAVRSEVGRLNTDPETYPDGIYLQVRAAQEDREEWKLDIWFVDQPERQPDLRHVQTLPPLLDGGARDAVLLIKERWAGRSEYGTVVSSADIYRAVLDDGVRDVDGFEQWRAERSASPR